MTEEIDRAQDCDESVNKLDLTLLLAFHRKTDMEEQIKITEKEILALTSLPYSSESSIAS